MEDFRIYGTRIAATIALLLLVAAGSAAAQERDVAALQKQLEKELVAPCCWNEAVATHQSGDSDRVKQEIATLLGEGKTREEVRAWMIDKYGPRILITPEAKGFNLLVWIGPFIMLLAGFAGVVLYLRRVRPEARNA